jgi:chromosome segregation ATPase
MSRTPLPGLFVLAVAVAAGAAAFVLVGRMAGALYGAAAVILGIIFQQKLARGHVAEKTSEEAPAARRRRPRGRLHVPRGRRAALRDELERATAELAARQEAGAELARELDDQRERTRLLQASFAERVSELTESLELQKSELSSAHEAHTARVAAHESELDGARRQLVAHESELDRARRQLEAHESHLDTTRQELAARESELDRTRQQLAERGAALVERTQQLELERRNARELADRLAQITAAYRDELARLAWSWRAHVEEIAALEAAVDAALPMS